MSKTIDTKTNNVSRTKKKRPDRRNRKQNALVTMIETNTLAGRVPRSLVPATVAPVEQYRSLLFVSEQNVVTSAGDFAIKDYNLNSPYDCDNSLGGNQPSGFNSMMAFYNFCQVMSVTVKLTIDNNETTNIFCGFIFRDIQPSTSLVSRANCVNAFGIPPCKGPVELAASSGMDRSRINCPQIALGTVVGNELAYVSQALNYACPANGNPPQRVWGGFILFAETSGGTLNSGCTVRLTIKMETRFFSLRDNIA